VKRLTDVAQGGSSAERVRRLPALLEQSYRRYREQSGSGLEHGSRGRDGALASVLLWWVSQGQAGAQQLLLLADGRVQRQALGVTQGGYFVDGQTDFVVTALQKNDGRFAALREDADVQRVWFQGKAKQMDSGSAARVGRLLIQQTNAFHAVVSADAPLVGAEADCSVMDVRRGFRWLQ
jgi:hypothetical protein